MTISFGHDPINEELERVLGLLETKSWNNSESQRVDLKEEAGRRDRQGNVLPGQPRNEDAAKQVAGESACMANTPGSGALILGVADDGTAIGTRLESEWLRQRVYELTDRQLTLEIQHIELNGERILLVRPPEAIEPIRWKGKISWRIGDRCEEVDAATWHTKRMLMFNYDWSAQSSTVSAEHTREASVEVARRFLSESTEPHATELASRPTGELLRRLNVIDGEGNLTNAGVLAFVGRDAPALDYIRRPASGADSTQRVRQGNRGLLEELQEVLTYISSHVSLVHLPSIASRGQVPELPEIAIREAVVNGLAHREWGIAEPTVVEHVGLTLRVTSPGGFFGGVNPSNIITHPSRSRNRSLTELFAALRIAEREGIGVDRMFGEMLRAGHRPPSIIEVDGPYVRTSLDGDSVDAAWVEWSNSMSPSGVAQELNSLLLLDRLVKHGWLDRPIAESVLQLGESETIGAINRLQSSEVNGQAVIQLVKGIPDHQDGAWQLTGAAHRALMEADKRLGSTRAWPNRGRLAVTYAQARGRISSTELGSLTYSSPSNVGGILRELEDDGQLTPSRSNRRGAGFYYKPTSDPSS